MMSEKARKNLSLLSFAVLVALFSTQSAASDIDVNAYFEIPLSGSTPFFSLRVGPGAAFHPGFDRGAEDLQRMEFRIRYGMDRGSAFFINGVPVKRSLMLNVSGAGASETEEEGFDWRLVGAGIFGVGVIYAATQIDFGDTNLSACSGRDCPPKEDDSSGSDSGSSITIERN